MPARPVALDRIHAVAGRLRLRPRHPLGPAELKSLAEKLAALPAVTRVLARPNTGSLIVEFPGPPEPVLEAIEAARIAAVRPPPAPPPIRQVAQFGFFRTDHAVRKATDGTLDLDTALALLFLMAAVTQLARGRVAGPATTLAMAALSLINRKDAPGD